MPVTRRDSTHHSITHHSSLVLSLHDKVLGMFDIFVAGAGLAGLQAARLLAARGLRVALADRKASVADSVHTTGIFVRKTWEDFPLPPEQLGRPIREVVLYSPARRYLALTAPRDEFRVGRMSWIYLYLLEICTRAGVVWMPSAR